MKVWALGITGFRVSGLGFWVTGISLAAVRLTFSGFRALDFPCFMDL